MKELCVVIDLIQRLQVPIAATPFGSGFPQWIAEPVDSVEIWESIYPETRPMLRNFASWRVQWWWLNGAYSGIKHLCGKRLTHGLCVDEVKKGGSKI